MKKTKGRIRLHRETLRQLEAGELPGVPAAAVTGPNTCETSCVPNTGCVKCWWSDVTR